MKSLFYFVCEEQMQEKTPNVSVNSILMCLWLQLAQKYGPVFSLRRGSERMVFISGYKMVKEALVNHLDSFVDRPAVPLFHKIFKGIGEFAWSWPCEAPAACLILGSLSATL